MRDFIKDPTRSFRWMRMLSFSLLMLLLYPLGLQAQDITLKGVVSDGTGEGLPGVSVLVKVPVTVRLRMLKESIR